MATPKKESKVGYVVISGCIQEGSKLYRLGQPYSPPTDELEAELVGGGIIALANTPEGHAAQAKASPVQEPETDAEADGGSGGDGSGEGNPVPGADGAGG